MDERKEEREELEKEILERGNVPEHVAVIMDGNGRWANYRDLPRIAGHHAAIESVRSTVRAAGRIGVDVLSLFTFSIENWERPLAEVNALMALLVETIPAEVPELMKNNVRLHLAGRLSDLPSEVRDTLHEACETLSGNTGLNLIMALSYGGQAEIVDAVRSIARRVAAGELGPDAVDEEVIQGSLYTAKFPNPDLLIRTSGEMRISNFYLWQLAYSELWFTPVLWPDFRGEHFYRAILEYQKRERRFGGVTTVTEQA